MNSVNLMGYVTGGIELRYTANGNPVANFGMALNRRYRQGEEVKQETTFVDLVAFNKTAEIADKYLGKGRPVAIEGRLRFRTWETEGGAKRSKLEVVVNQLHLMPRNGKDGSDSDSSVEEVAEEIPF
jgi:single-strand DNA-binding protein